MKYVWALVGPLVLARRRPRRRSPPAAPYADAAASSASESAAEHAARLHARSRLLLAADRAQPVVPGLILLAPRGAHEGSKGTRSDEQFFEISSTGSNDVPEAALRAYHHAEKVMATADPGCEISWTLLAAIGRVESNHGRFGGAAARLRRRLAPGDPRPAARRRRRLRGDRGQRQRHPGPRQGLGPRRGPDAVPARDLALGGPRR